LCAVKSEVKQFILIHFLPGEDDQDLQDDDLLFEGGIVDSAGIMTFISFLEERFGIEVLDEELFPENFASVSHIVEYVEAKLKEKLGIQPEEHGFEQ